MIYFFLFSCACLNKKYFFHARWLTKRSSSNDWSTPLLYVKKVFWTNLKKFKQSKELLNAFIGWRKYGPYDLTLDFGSALVGVSGWLMSILQSALTLMP